MAKKNAESDDISVDGLILAELQTTNRLLAVLATRGMDQREAIALLHEISFSPRAIASALSMTSNAVSVAIHRMKKADQVVTQKTNGAAVTGGELEQNG